jgi:UDP-glucose 4-epimerase
MRILITGIASKFGRLVAELLVQNGHEVLGIDRRPWPDAPQGVTMFNTDIRKRPAEDVFRTRQPEAVVHLATVTHFSASAHERHRINLGGTRAIFDHCHQYGVKQAIFVGRHTFYGAAPDSPMYHTEDEPPMGVNTFPELGDLVAADLYAASALWRYPEIDTVVLRMCYVLGPSQQGTLASYLAGPRVPTVMGFDPLYQFIHEHDAAEAIRLALEARLRGVYNVTGPQPVPISLLIRQTGRTQLPLPEPVFRRALGRFGLPNLPPGAVNHVKYSIVVDGEAFRQATGFTHRFDEIQTMEAFRWA